MNDDPTSLDRLNDLVLPPAVPWWPPAPGWYWLGGVVMLVLLVMLYRAWAKWRANAYRREALRELEVAGDAAAVASVLRRAALVVAPRSAVAPLSGEGWADWLGGWVAEPMPAGVREQLATGVYAPRGQEDGIADLRVYAGHWLVAHRHPPDGTPAPDR